MKCAAYARSSISNGKEDEEYINLSVQIQQIESWAKVNGKIVAEKYLDLAHQPETRVNHYY